MEVSDGFIWNTDGVYMMIILRPDRENCEKGGKKRSVKSRSDA